MKTTEVDTLERFQASLEDEFASRFPRSKAAFGARRGHLLVILAEITRMGKRIEDVSAASAISRSDFYRVMTEMGRAVDLNVEDPVIREKIHDAWIEIRLA